MDRFDTILENTIVRLLPILDSHREALRKSVLQTQPAHWTYTLKDASADFDGWFDALLEKQAAGRQFFYAVSDQSSGEILGSTSFSAIEPAHDRLEIGSTWYVPRAQGTKVNPACKLLLLTHAFERLGCNRVELKCDALNLHSRRAIAKLGATEEGMLREHMRVPDHKGGYRHRDTVYFSILAKEWPGVRHGLETRLKN